MYTTVYRSVYSLYIRPWQYIYLESDILAIDLPTVASYYLYYILHIHAYTGPQ